MVILSIIASILANGIVHFGPGYMPAQPIPHAQQRLFLIFDPLIRLQTGQIHLAAFLLAAAGSFLLLVQIPAIFRQAWQQQSEAQKQRPGKKIQLDECYR